MFALNQHMRRASRREIAARAGAFGTLGRLATEAAIQAQVSEFERLRWLPGPGQLLRADGHCSFAAESPWAFIMPMRRTRARKQEGTVDGRVISPVVTRSF
uniref:Uncharacterized protein n=1 Tax=Arundo donax TaxID=35708 RepID=A0A0A9F7E9_ARUDO